MRAGRYWILLSRFLMIAVSWSTSVADRLPRPFHLNALMGKRGRPTSFLGLCSRAQTRKISSRTPMYAAPSVPASHSSAQS